MFDSWYRQAFVCMFLLFTLVALVARLSLYAGSVKASSANFEQIGLKKGKDHAHTQTNKREKRCLNLILE